MSLLARLTRFLRRADHPETSAPDVEEGAVPQWLIIGLGNPGAEYAVTAHNIGYMAADELAPATGYSPQRGNQALVQHLDVDGTPVALVRSTTYMNLSGEAVAPLAARWGIAPDHVIALHDELDLPRGTVRLKLGGSENGHNGLKSLSEQLGTRDYLRVRIGIGRPAAGATVTDHVLGAIDFDAAAACERAARAARLLVTSGLPQAQNTIHAEK
ncbi:aminoacyl-tRNA hydrolase [Corynebacterium sp. 13CS0277]|uniref:aminoacyl-tRNA hydrolase n=1 Tax=Corynebacterium sp. 13CS0277 TaxID=2071994 RepID=UPI000D0310C7|nr:aminoacyl-tRNA hydrolase [Corynebacterium sp. 13CS0277]PRQ12453.1 aminoacyl-tRNA hydrolase [Corynebacterium sp. 13CS0277]